jgi:type III secretion protein Q
LRVNQILDLGCKATDPVDLIVDGRRIARGELVDIEGRLGVRITQVLV